MMRRCLTALVRDMWVLLGKDKHGNLMISMLVYIQTHVTSNIDLCSQSCSPIAIAWVQEGGYCHLEKPWAFPCLVALAVTWE